MSKINEDIFAHACMTYFNMGTFSPDAKYVRKFLEGSQDETEYSFLSHNQRNLVQCYDELSELKAISEQRGY